MELKSILNYILKNVNKDGGKETDKSIDEMIKTLKDYDYNFLAYSLINCYFIYFKKTI